MREFEASRMAEGNRLFPAQIKIDDFGVTLKVPGFFSGKEKSLSFTEISSINVESPMMGYSSILFRTIGFDQITAKGFSKSDANEIKELVQGGIMNTRGNSNQGNGGNGMNVTIHQKSKEEIEADELAEIRRKREEEKQKINNEVESISKIHFDNDATQIANTLNQLLTLSNAKGGIKLKIAIYEKIEFGVMKLDSIGEKQQAEYFRAKNKKITWLTKFLAFFD